LSDNLPNEELSRKRDVDGTEYIFIEGLPYAASIFSEEPSAVNDYASAYRKYILETDPYAGSYAQKLDAFIKKVYRPDLVRIGLADGSFPGIPGSEVIYPETIENVEGLDVGGRNYHHSLLLTAVLNGMFGDKMNTFQLLL